VTYTDANQDQATFWTRVGRNASEWSQSPLSSFSELSVLPDKANYTVSGLRLNQIRHVLPICAGLWSIPRTETAKISWISPYPLARVLVAYGNGSFLDYTVNVTTNAGPQVAEVQLGKCLGMACRLGHCCAFVPG
jgi:hypothetical protein